MKQICDLRAFRLCFRKGDKQFCFAKSPFPAFFLLSLRPKNSQKQAILTCFRLFFILFAQKWRFWGDHMFALISNLQTVVSSQFSLCFRKSLFFAYSSLSVSFFIIQYSLFIYRKRILNE